MYPGVSIASIAARSPRFHVASQNVRIRAFRSSFTRDITGGLALPAVSGRSSSRRSGQVGPHGLGLQELLERLSAAVPPVARVLEAPERDRRIERIVTVDEHAAGVQQR